MDQLNAVVLKKVPKQSSESDKKLPGSLEHVRKFNFNQTYGAENCANMLNLHGQQQKELKAKFEQLK